MGRGATRTGAYRDAVHGPALLVGNVTASQLRIVSYDHVGARVVDRARSRAFYADLGFVPEPGEGDIQGRAVGLINADGVRVNLIMNGVPPPRGCNVLMDSDAKWPGWTHPAFVVDHLDSVLAWAAAHAIVVTEGPVVWGRRRVCFLRDPDGNVLEFDELLE
jgi:catechol 2,3-dioxygenase-like lactoylglutathione lyase family enzyme